MFMDYAGHKAHDASSVSSGDPEGANKGGASGRFQRTDAWRFIDNDSDGTRRRSAEAKRRNHLT